VIEEKYTRYVWPRGESRSPTGRPCFAHTSPRAIARRAYENRANDKRRGRAVFMPIRYADDFIVLVARDSEPGSRASAEQEKATLARELEEKLGLALSEEKTLVTPVTSTMRFLGHHLRVRRHPNHGRLVPRAVIPKERSQRLRRTIKGIFRRRSFGETLENRLRWLNPLLRGWANFYKHAWGAKHVFVANDHFVWWTIYRWLRQKHPKTRMREIYARYGWRKPRGRMMRWRDGDVKLVAMSATHVGPFRLSWLKTPDFASTSMESPVRNERRTPGSARSGRKPRGATRG